jgi:hypothetical protein
MSSGESVADLQTRAAALEEAIAIKERRVFGLSRNRARKRE